VDGQSTERLDSGEEIGSDSVSCWRGIRYEDEMTLSLLQQKLNDLGTGIQIITGRYAA